MSGLADTIPGLAEAEAKYKSDQFEAFAGIEPRISSIEILPFTMRMYMDLEGCGNKFFNDGTPAEEDVAQFFWRVSPVYSRDDRDLRDGYIAGITLVLVNYGYANAVIDIYEYIRRSWAGMPSFKSSGSRSSSPATWASTLVHIFAKEYGWTEEYVLDLPFRRLWQYLNRIMEDRDPDYKEKCAEAQKIRNQWLKAQNAEPPK